MRNWRRCRRHKVSSNLYLRTRNGHFKCYSCLCCWPNCGYSNATGVQRDSIASLQRGGNKGIRECNILFGTQIGKRGRWLLSSNHEQKTIELLLTLFLQDSYALATPMATDFPKGKEDREALPNNSKYRTTTRKLLCWTTTTRPNIDTTVGILRGVWKLVHQHRVTGELSKVKLDTWNEQWALS